MTAPAVYTRLRRRPRLRSLRERDFMRQVLLQYWWGHDQAPNLRSESRTLTSPAACLQRPPSASFSMFLLLMAHLVLAISMRAPFTGHVRIRWGYLSAALTSNSQIRNLLIKTVKHKWRTQA
jgi:hypothetical protein